MYRSVNHIHGCIKELEHFFRLLLEVAEVDISNVFEFSQLFTQTTYFTLLNNVTFCDYNETILNALESISLSMLDV